jgi:hypothetical protein
MPIDWNALLSEGLLQSIPLISKIFTAPFILSIFIPAAVGGKMFGKEGWTFGAIMGLFFSSTLGFLN